MANLTQIKLPNGNTYNFQDTVSGYCTANGHNHFYMQATVSNANDADFGINFISGGATNNPFSFWATIYTTGSNNGYRQQLAIPWGAGETGSIAVRVMDSGSWGAWKYIPYLKDYIRTRNYDNGITITYEHPNICFYVNDQKILTIARTIS